MSVFLDVDEEPRETIEDICGEYGFRVRWRVLDHWADVEVFHVVAKSTECEAPQFNRKGSTFIPDCVASIDEAEPYLTGYVKWDGCTEFDMGQPHWCDLEDYKKHCELLRYLYNRAFELMGREPDEWWMP